MPRSSGSKRNKYIDSNLSVFPENWKIDVNTGSIRQLYTTNVAGDTTSVYSGKIALAFDATGDSIVTPVLPAPASKFSFWIKNANATGTVAVYGFDGFQWHSLGEASTISYRSGGIADFSANIPVECIQFKMIYTDENPDLNSPTAIDEISYTYGGIVKTRDYLVENKRITETSAPVTGLKDNTDYFYTVKSTNDFETSLESNTIDVFGYAGSLSKPVLKEFTDIKGGAIYSQLEHSHRIQRICRLQCLYPHCPKRRNKNHSPRKFRCFYGRHDRSSGRRRRYNELRRIYNCP